MKPVRICGIALAAALLAACATQQQQQAGAGPRSPNQLKQDELKAMEAQGQRNDFDKVRIN